MDIVVTWGAYLGEEPDITPLVICIQYNSVYELREKIIEEQKVWLPLYEKWCIDEKEWEHRNYFLYQYKNNKIHFPNGEWDQEVIEHQKKCPKFPDGNVIIGGQKFNLWAFLLGKNMEMPYYLPKIMLLEDWFDLKLKEQQEK